MATPPRHDQRQADTQPKPRPGRLKRLTSGFFAEFAKLFGMYQNWLPGK